MNNDMETLLTKALSLIDSSKNICITSHINPDGDSVGSVLALGMALKKNKCKKIYMIIDDEIPKELLFLPEIDLIKKENSVEELDLLIALDCGDIDRIAVSEKLIKTSKFVINIDHHITNTCFGDLNIISPDSSSTGEMIYDILKSMNMKIDKDIATSLYVAISTDTGSFKYDSTTSKTHVIASELLDAGIDNNYINTNLYHSRSIEKTSLLIASLNSMELLKQGKFALAIVTKEMLEKCNASIEDADIIIDFIRDIDSVEVACIIKEIDDGILKIGFRSKRYVDVSEIAKKFNGGGHIRAAGCKLNCSIEEGKRLILQEIDKVLR